MFLHSGENCALNFLYKDSIQHVIWIPLGLIPPIVNIPNFVFFVQSCKSCVVKTFDSNIVKTHYFDYPRLEMIAKNANCE